MRIDDTEEEKIRSKGNFTLEPVRMVRLWARGREKSRPTWLAAELELTLSGGPDKQTMLLEEVDMLPQADKMFVCLLTKRVLFTILLSLTTTRKDYNKNNFI